MHHGGGGGVRQLGVAVATASLLACAARERPPAAEPGSPPSGAVSFRLIEDPAGQSGKQTIDGRPQELVAPVARGSNPTPHYPPEALAQGCQDATLLVRVIIDAEGKVGEIRDSPFVRATQDPCTPLFRSATEQAVRLWQFSPAFRQVLVKPASEGPLGQPKWDTQPIPWYADFAFRFQVVEGKGMVGVPK